MGEATYKVLEIKCHGAPYEIGHQHGAAAKQQVAGSLAFYRGLFHTACSMGWDAVHKEAFTYVQGLERLCPRYAEEMRGLADGAGVDFLDIVALNVRSEITFGLFTNNPTVTVEHDGCTSLACRDEAGNVFLTQNWDWEVAQADNLVILHVSQPGTGLPEFSMVTEGGVIGKIGLNSNGVGVCLNAIRARGVDVYKLPTHLALRVALESTSARAAADSIQAMGSAGSAHILVSDNKKALGLECTSVGIKVIEMDGDGMIIHANHMALKHQGLNEPPWLPDSEKRVERLTTLFKQAKPSSTVNDAFIYRLFQDEDGYPRSINRCQTGSSKAQTLFNIIMDLASKKAMVTFGRPTDSSKRVQLAF